MRRRRYSWYYLPMNHMLNALFSPPVPKSMGQHYQWYPLRGFPKSTRHTRQMLMLRQNWRERDMPLPTIIVTVFRQLCCGFLTPLGRGATMKEIAVR